MHSESTIKLLSDAHTANINSALTAEEYEIKRNKTDLDRFFPMRTLRFVELPKELYNEPYSFHDNGLKPVMIAMDPTSLRPRFSFAIDNYGTAICYVGKLLISESLQGVVTRGSLPEKISSNFSVLSVYDAYGLDVAYAFLKYLYYQKYDNNSWLVVYLQGSLFMLQDDAPESQHTSEDVLYLSSQIMLELIQIDTEKKNPPESLAKTQPFPDIPKEFSQNMTENVRTVKCTTFPKITEVISYDQPMTYLDNNVFSLSHRNKGTYYSWTLKRKQDKFILSKEVITKIVKQFTYDQVVASSIHTYVRVYNEKGCNGKQSTGVMLRNIARSTNISEICAWIVQLSYDTEAKTPRIFTGLNELQDELRRLVSTAVQQLI